MKTNTKIVIGIASLLVVGGTISAYIWYAKSKKKKTALLEAVPTPDRTTPIPTPDRTTLVPTTPTVPDAGITQQAYIKQLMANTDAKIAEIATIDGRINTIAHQQKIIYDKIVEGFKFPNVVNGVPTGRDAMLNAYKKSIEDLEVVKVDLTNQKASAQKALTDYKTELTKYI